MLKLKSFVQQLKLQKSEGFTLIEIIVSIAIIAVAVGLAGFGLNVLFSANVDAMGNDIYHEFRDMKFRTLNEFDTDYQLVLTYDSTRKRYGYEVHKRFTDTSVSPSVVSNSVVKEVSYRPTLLIERWDDDSGSWIELNDPSIDLTVTSENVTFPFDHSTGGIKATTLSGATTNSLVSNATETVGIYRIVSTRSNDKHVLTIVKLTGRVIISD